MRKRELRIVVASPRDVKSERGLLPALIAELERSLGDLLAVSLRVIMWETDAYPGFRTGGAQALIDEVLRIDQCDILVGIFWKRFGSPVSDADSGTEHEIRLALASWKNSGTPQMMMYFNEKPFMPSSELEIEQFGRVLKFKKDFPKEGLWWTYKGKNSFSTLVRSHLAEQIKAASAKPLKRSCDPSKTSSTKRKPSGKAAAASAAFVTAYRQRFSSLYSRWDLGPLGTTQSGATTRPLEISLDDIYLPLRLANNFADSGTGQGREYSHIALLTRSIPLVVRGAAGSGKTTWLRWNFRRLLLEDAALPIMVELRRLARSWQGLNMGAQRSIDAYIDEFVVEQMGGTWNGFMGPTLSDADAPRPVLLIDGWDELGSLGEDFRHKLLGFIKENKRVRVVVTSRPYGEARPSNSDGFEVLDIQPLPDDDIMRLAKRFFELSCRDDETNVPFYTSRFSQALKRSPEALSLVRTPLLLTMMLMISKSSPLPDKRHLLYQKCIDALLNAVPDRRQEEGAVFGRNQWRPDDSEERLRIVANLAFHIQEQGYEETGRGAIVRTRDELLAFLPKPWSYSDRQRFLNWLLGATGLLIDRADESVAFAHLSYPSEQTHG
jgi:hypothetical protein